MAPLLFLAGWCLLVLPGLTRRLGRRLDPAEWSRLCLAALVAGAVVVEVAAVLYSLPVVFRSFGVTSLAEACERTFEVLLHGDADLGWFAVAIAACLPMVAVRGLLGGRRLHATVRAGVPGAERHVAPGYDLVVVPTETPLAVAVDGREPLVVISQGVRARLSEPEFDAVVRHEAAHLKYRHQRYLLVAAALDGLAIVPGLRRSLAALRAALERWADESAAAGPGGSRRAVRQALVGMTTASLGPAASQFSAADSVLERLDALERAPRTPPLLSHTVLYVPGLATLVVALVAIAGWAGQMNHVLALAGLCPAGAG